MTCLPGALLNVLFASTCLAAAPKRTTVYQAEDARLDAARAEVVAQASFDSKKGVALKAGAASYLSTNPCPPDLTFRVLEPQAGRFSFRTVAATDAAGTEAMRKATSKLASLYAQLQVGSQRPTRRVVFVPWSAPDSCSQFLGSFDLTNGAQDIRVWLPPGVRLDRLEIHPYRAPAFPKEAAAYRPAVLPPPYHPRLWVNSNSLPQVRANLAHPENLKTWERVRKAAQKPFAFTFSGDQEVAYNTPLERAAANKAFVYLMQGDARLGREAVQLMLDYLARVEFGNLLDITREIGAAIYTAACVYDWCYPLCAPAEREVFRRHMLRLAEEMECGWPPFKGTVVNGHGNEAMTNRDLLSMGIALYDEDPLPYQYCAYRLLEELVPMRRFEYQSPRHNQGVSYAAYRFGWEMHAAWLFRRMTGQEVFDANIKSVPLYWLYMRLPNGELLRDGDGVPAARYYGYSQTALLCYAYSRDPLLKGEFMRQGGASSESLLYLLLNDPSLPAEPRFDTLSLTLNFGPVLSGMIARTGWSVATNSNDVVAEIKGGGYHFGNHQHADAGALQIYYRGLQAADLGQYKFYGTPYDLNFNKRSVAHSMLLVVDPQEKFLGTPANDGGSRFLQSHPRTPEQAQQDPLFHYGRAVSCSFGPAADRPSFSYFSADLTGAYSKKLSAFTRTFCFLNLDNPANPAAIILLDDVSAAKPEFKKYWQLNTLQPPELTARGARLSSSAFGVTGHLDVCMLWPTPEARTVTVKSNDEVYDVFGYSVTPPASSSPEGRGHRLLFSPKQASRHDAFLTLLQACDAGAPPLPHDVSETSSAVVLRIADRIVSLAKGTGLLAAPFELAVPGDGKTYQVLLAGLQPGAWAVTDESGRAVLQAKSEQGKNTLFFLAQGGRYRVALQPAP